MTKTKTNVTLTVGYYEFHLYINNKMVYVLDGDCTESWYEYEDSRDYAELCVEGILEELKDNDDWDDYNLVLENKVEVINTIASFVADFIE